jgi:hypothetical protein
MRHNHTPHTRANYSLGDLIYAVGSFSRNRREMAAAVTDLIGSGRVRFVRTRRTRRHQS